MTFWTLKIEKIGFSDLEIFSIRVCLLVKGEGGHFKNLGVTKIYHEIPSQICIAQMTFQTLKKLQKF